MPRNVESLNDLQLSSYIASVQKLLHDLEAIEEDAITEETRREREHTLHRARQLYALLQAEQVKRIKKTIDAWLGKMEEENDAE